ncbi:hypothetical protein KJ612_06435, partial [Myxococcota bacterium]|nr:hypothetical protein [Myxococcota bacterium]
AVAGQREGGAQNEHRDESENDGIALCMAHEITPTGLARKTPENNGCRREGFSGLIFETWVLC